MCSTIINKTSHDQIWPTPRGYTHKLMLGFAWCTAIVGGTFIHWIRQMLEVQIRMIATREKNLGYIDISTW